MEDIKAVKKRSSRLRNRHPGRVPVIILPRPEVSLDTVRFLVPMELRLGEFLCTLRNYVKLTKTQSLIVFVDGTLPGMQETMETLDDKYRNADGYLYITVARENTFG